MTIDDLVEWARVGVCAAREVRDITLAEEKQLTAELDGKVLRAHVEIINGEPVTVIDEYQIRGIILRQTT